MQAALAGKEIEIEEDLGLSIQDVNYKLELEITKFNNYSNLLDKLKSSNNTIYEDKIKEIEDILKEIKTNIDTINSIKTKIENGELVIGLLLTEIKEFEDIEIVNNNEFNPTPLESKIETAQFELNTSNSVNVNLTDDSLDLVDGEEVELEIDLTSNEREKMESLDLDKFEIRIRKKDKVVATLASTRYLKQELLVYEPLLNMDKNDPKVRRLLSITALIKLQLNAKVDVTDLVNRYSNEFHALLTELTGYDYRRERETLLTKNPSNSYEYDYLTDMKMMLHLANIFMYEKVIGTKENLAILSDINNENYDKVINEIFGEKEEGDNNISLIQNIKNWVNTIKNDLSMTNNIYDKFKNMLKNTTETVKTMSLKIKGVINSVTNPTPIENGRDNKIDEIIKQDKGFIAISKDGVLYDLNGEKVKLSDKQEKVSYTAPHYLVLKFNNQLYPTVLDTAIISEEDQSKLEKLIISKILNPGTFIVEEFNSITYTRSMVSKEEKVKNALYVYRDNGMITFYIGDNGKFKEIKLVDGELTIEGDKLKFEQWLKNRRYNVSTKINNETVKSKLNNFSTKVSPQFNEAGEITKMFSIKGRRNMTAKLSLDETVKVKEATVEEMAKEIYGDKSKDFIDKYNKLPKEKQKNLLEKLKKQYNEFKCK